MSTAIWTLLHLLGVIVWVGGMFFAHVALRPVVAELLQPPQRLPLLAGVLGRFFKWVAWSIALILASGIALMVQVKAGGGRLGPQIHAMAAVGVVMMIIFFHIRFGPFKRLLAAVVAQDWPAGGAAMGRVRLLVLVNLVLGIVTVVLALLGSAWS